MVTIGNVIQEWANVAGPDPLVAYIQAAVTVDGVGVKVATMIGVQPYERGTCRAAGGDVRPFLITWWGDESDFRNVPADRREEVEGALFEARERLWRETLAQRETG